MEKKELGFIIDDHEDGYMHISWPHTNSNGVKKILTLSFWKPSLEMRGKLMEAVMEEDFQALSDLWDIDEGGKPEEEPNFGEWKH